MRDFERGAQRFYLAGVYALLGLGALVFSWPLLWMLGASVKADREIFSGASARNLMPATPRPQLRSPYLYDRAFPEAEGPRSQELVPALQKALEGQGYAWPADLDKAEARALVARGAYTRLREILPEAAWSLPLDELLEKAVAELTPAMAADLLVQCRRGILLSKLRARSFDLQEQVLVSPEGAAKAWEISGDAKAELRPATEDRQKSALLAYDFSGGDGFTLSQTFTLDFNAERLYRLHLAMRYDDSWLPMEVYVEKLGKRLKADLALPMADNLWWTIILQEPGLDDKTNKIREWTLIKEAGDSEVTDPRQVKVVLEFKKASPLQAWGYKIRRNYLKVFDNMPFWRYVSTSVFLVVLNLIGTLLSCSLVAYSFARLRWPGRSASFALMLATMMVPAQVTMIPFFLIIRWLGWYNTLTPLWACSFFASAFNVFLLHQFFKGIPKDLEDAARIDGCGPVKTWWLIMMPLVKPSLATIAIFTFMGVWNDFMGPLIYLNDQRLYPLSLGLYALNVQSANNLGANASMSMMMAGSALMILPVVVMFFFAQRYFIQGITMTGMKG